MAAREISPQQAQLMRWIKANGVGSFTLTEAVQATYGDDVPLNGRVIVNCQIKSVAKRMKGTCCSIERVSRIGRGNYAIYSYRCTNADN